MLAVVWQIRQRKAIQDLKHQECQLELDALPNRLPVKFPIGSCPGSGVVLQTGPGYKQTGPFSSGVRCLDNPPPDITRL